MVSELSRVLAGGLGGIFDAIAVSSAVPIRMKFMGERVAEDFALMENRYEVEYATDASAPATDIDVRVARTGVTVQLSSYRPF
jgi:hypothetical protein